jgi:putative ABC transport system substrate-binding protein
MVPTGCRTAKQLQARTERARMTGRRRHGIAACLACGLLALGSHSDAQPAKSYRIGVLGQGNPPTNAIPGADYRQGLRDLNYEEGRNVAVEFRYGAGSADKLLELAGELVRMKIDVIVTVGDSAALAAKRATTSIPIVATEFGSDPVKAGLVTSLGRPEGNITGLTALSEELWQKRLGILRELVPRLGRVAVLVNPKNPGSAVCVDEIRAASSAMGIRAQAFEVSDANAIERAFATMLNERPDALALCWDSVTLEYAHAIADLALKRRLPTVAPLREYVKAGALVSFGTNLAAHRRRAAYYTDKIIKGAKPSELPVERPTNFELVLNLATAKALGISVPSSLGLVADDFVE